MIKLEIKDASRSNVLSKSFRIAQVIKVKQIVITIRPEVSILFTFYPIVEQSDSFIPFMYNLILIPSTISSHM
jgi:hypothetical protein